MKHILFYCLLLFFFLSCNSGKGNKYTETPFVNIPLDRKDNPAFFDSLFQYNHYVILETTNESLIGHTGKIVFYRGDIYILDDKENKVLVFDKQGKYLRQYSHVGQGPGEYLSLRDFVIKEDTLFLLDRLGAKLLEYTLDDSLIQVTNVEKARGFHLFESGEYALNQELGNADLFTDEQYYSYVCYNGNTPTYKNCPFNKELCGLSFSQDGGSNSFYFYNDSLFTFFPYNDTIYCVDRKEGTLTPYVSIGIGDESIKIDDSNIQVKEKRDKGIVNTIFSFYKWGNWLFFSYYYKDENRSYVLTDISGNILFRVR